MMTLARGYQAVMVRYFFAYLCCARPFCPVHHFYHWQRLMGTWQTIYPYSITADNLWVSLTTMPSIINALCYYGQLLLIKRVHCNSMQTAPTISAPWLCVFTQNSAALRCRCQIYNIFALLIIPAHWQTDWCIKSRYQTHLILQRFVRLDQWITYTATESLPINRA